MSWSIDFVDKFAGEVKAMNQSASSLRLTSGSMNILLG